MTFGSRISEAASRLSAAGIASARLDAEVLLAIAAGVGRSWVLARLRDEVEEGVCDRFEELIARRMAREPVAYIIGEKEFFSLDFAVTQGVLIPRPETELLVEETLKRAVRGGRVLDVGTGSGCIAVALAVNRADLEVSACDVSPQALEVAHRNARRHQVDARVRFIESDLFGGLADECFDAIVSNPPYVADAAELEPELAWEPVSALRAGPDGLAVIRNLLAESRTRLNPGGFAIVEIGSDQAELACCAAAEAGFLDIDIVRDLAGHPRILRAS